MTTVGQTAAVPGVSLTPSLHSLFSVGGRTGRLNKKEVTNQTRKGRGEALPGILNQSPGSHRLLKSLSAQSADGMGRAAAAGARSGQISMHTGHTDLDRRTARELRHRELPLHSFTSFTLRGGTEVNEIIARWHRDISARSPRSPRSGRGVLPWAGARNVRRGYPPSWNEVNEVNEKDGRQCRLSKILVHLGSRPEVNEVNEGVQHV